MKHVRFEVISSGLEPLFEMDLKSGRGADAQDSRECGAPMSHLTGPRPVAGRGGLYSGWAGAVCTSAHGSEQCHRIHIPVSSLLGRRRGR